MVKIGMLNRNLALEAVRVTEAAAIAASSWIGRGDEKAADQAAVNAMRSALGEMMISGTVVIGEGERDKAPMLYIGEKVGCGDKNAPEVDIALDPLEGTTICATGGPNSLAVIAFADKGCFLHAPDVYMEKIAIGISANNIVDLDNTIEENLESLAIAKNLKVQDLRVIVLDRPRHSELIARIKATGAKLFLIGDGDVAAVIAVTAAFDNADIYVGIGGAPEGVLAAAALRATGGFMMGRLIFTTDEEKARACRMGIKDLDKKYTTEELASGDVMFAATGVTGGSMLDGVKIKNGTISTNSLVMRAKTGTVRTIYTNYRSA